MPNFRIQIPNAHFHKHWHDQAAHKGRIRTWFNQAARKHRRRENRLAKAQRVFPRPVSGLVRPVVHCQTIRYNSKKRAGKGFTLQELKEAKINRREALGIGISVDYRRKNRSEQSLRENVARLQQYKANLIVFPRKCNRSKPKAADSSKDQQSKAEQVSLLCSRNASKSFRARSDFYCVFRSSAMLCRLSRLPRLSLPTRSPRRTRTRRSTTPSVWPAPIPSSSASARYASLPAQFFMRLRKVGAMLARTWPFSRILRFSYLFCRSVRRRLRRRRLRMPRSRPKQRVPVGLPLETFSRVSGGCALPVISARFAEVLPAALKMLTGFVYLGQGRGICYKMRGLIGFSFV
jgi:ribosomal protein L13E